VTSPQAGAEAEPGQEQEPGREPEQVQEQAGAGPAGEAPWRRLHPVTPVLRSWRVLVVLLVLYGQQRGTDAVTGGGADVPGHLELLIALGVLAGAVVVSVAVSALAWRMTRYQVDAEAVRLHTGVLFRQQRSARLDRLQAVDVVQPLLARLLGFAELRLEVAGGSGSDVRLAYLREADAQRLRNALLARSAGLSFEGEDAPEAVDRTVLEVPLPRLLGSLALSGGTIALAVFLVALAVAAVLADAQVLLLGAGPAVLGVAAGLWTSFTRSASWRVAVAGDGLRLRHGLLETRTQTVPPGRVQAVRLSQPLLWRRAGWWKLQVNVAGYGGASPSTGGDSSLLVPVATRSEAEEVLALVLPALLDPLRDPLPDPLPDPAQPDAGAAFRRDVERGLDGVGEDGGWLTAPRRARRLDPVAWRRHGVLVTEHALLVRRGRLGRQLDVVPHERTQSLGLVQGPLQRRLGLATLAAHSTPGPVSPTAAHLDAQVAASLLQEQAARARRARAAAGPERWMESPRTPPTEAGPAPHAEPGEG